MIQIVYVALAISMFLLGCNHFSAKRPTSAESLVFEMTQPEPIVSATPRKPANHGDSEWAANDSHVENALCRNTLPKTTSEIQAFYAKLPKEQGLEPGGVSEMYGFKIIDERPQLILALSKLLRSGEIARPLDTENMASKFDIPKNCTKVLCIATVIFGPEVGPQMVFVMDQFDINTSPYSFNSSSLFNAGEIKDVIRSLELIEVSTKPFDSNQKLTKFKRGYTLAIYDNDDGEVLANASMTFFDGWSEKNSLTRQQILFHEFAHNYADSEFSNYDVSETWLKQSNWKKLSDSEFKIAKDKIMKGHPFVSSYAEANPWEDFAESVTAYRLNPQHLKRTSPQKYDIIKMLVFDGREFDKTSNCRKEPNVARIKKSILDSKFKLETADLEKVTAACRMPFYRSYLNHMPLSSFNECVNFESTLIWHSKNATKYPELVSNGLFDKNLKFSQLKFPEVQQQALNLLMPEAANWLYKELQDQSHELSSQGDKAEYCGAWGKMRLSPYPNPGKNKSEWSQKTIYRNYDYAPNPGAAISLCYDLTGHYSPPQKTKTKKIWDWIRSQAHIESEDTLTQRGVTKEAILQNIEMRFQYRGN